MKKNVWKNVLAGALAASALLAFAGCGSQDDANTASDTASNTNTSQTEESDYDYIMSKGEMVIGYTLFAPMNYKEGDELVGFETEFAQAVCEKLGVTPKFQEINWDSKEIELSSKTIDCIWNGMTITDDRQANMSITVPYMDNRQVMVVRQDDVDKYTESVDGATVVAEAGSTGETLAQSDEFFANASYTPVDSQAKGLMDVKSGVSDVALGDYVMAIGSVGGGTDYSDLALIDKGFASQYYGVAFRKGSDMTEKVNAAMQELASDGTLKTIADKYNLAELLLLK